MLKKIWLTIRRHKVMLFLGILLPFYTRTEVFPTFIEHIGWPFYIFICLFYILCYISIGDFLGRVFKEQKKTHLIVFSVFMCLYFLIHCSRTIISTIMFFDSFGAIFNFLMHFIYFPMALFTIPAVVFVDKLQHKSIKRALKYSSIILWIISIIGFIAMIPVVSGVIAALIVLIIITIFVIYRLYVLIKNKEEARFIDIVISLTFIMMSLAFYLPSILARPL